METGGGVLDAVGTASSGCKETGGGVLVAGFSDAVGMVFAGLGLGFDGLTD